MKDDTTQERCPTCGSIAPMIHGIGDPKKWGKAICPDPWHDAPASTQRSAPTTQNEVRVDVSNLPKHRPFVSPASVAELWSTPELGTCEGDKLLVCSAKHVGQHRKSISCLNWKPLATESVASPQQERQVMPTESTTTKPDVTGGRPSGNESVSVASERGGAREFYEATSWKGMWPKLLEARSAYQFAEAYAESRVSALKAHVKEVEKDALRKRQMAIVARDELAALREKLESLASAPFELTSSFSERLRELLADLAPESAREASLDCNGEFTSRGAWFMLEVDGVEHSWRVSHEDVKELLSTLNWLDGKFNATPGSGSI